MDSIKVARLVRQHKATVSPDDADTHEALERAINAIAETETLRVQLERARRAPEQAEFEVRVWWKTSGRYGVDYSGSAPGWQTVAWCSMRQYAGIVADALLQPERGAGEENAYRKAEVWGPGRIGHEQERRLYDLMVLRPHQRRPERCLQDLVPPLPPAARGRPLLDGRRRRAQAG